ncbi:Ku protein [soil metagenome]
MARPVWKGHITFGLINIPVTLYPAEERTDLRLHLLDSRDQNRVQYERVNAETGEEVPWNAIVKGYEFSKGSYVIIGDEDFKRAAPEATKTVDIESFVRPGEIDPMFFDRPYYLEPSKGGEKGYILLRDTLSDSELVGVARVVIRSRQYMAALMPHKNALVLNLLRYPQELRASADLKVPGEGEAGVKVSAAEKKMARTLVESMTGAWKPEEFHDEYRGKLLKWIQERAKAGDLASAPALEEKEEELPATLNFMVLLKKSVEGKGKAKGAKSSAKRGSGDDAADTGGDAEVATTGRGGKAAGGANSGAKGAKAKAPAKAARRKAG